MEVFEKQQQKISKVKSQYIFRNYVRHLISLVLSKFYQLRNYDAFYSSQHFNTIHEIYFNDKFSLQKIKMLDS